MNDLTRMNQTMTSRELFAMLGYSKLNNLHTALHNMFEDEIKDGLEIQPSFDNRGYVEFYTLNEILSKMFVASKDKSYLRKITQYWIDKKSVPKVIEVQPVQQIAPLSQADSFMALDLMTKALNLPESGKLQVYAAGMQDYPRFVQALPVYAVDAPVIDGFIESNTIGSSLSAHAISHHLKNHGVKLSATVLNKSLVSEGYLEIKTRRSSALSAVDGWKNYKSVTEKGLEFGKNLVNLKSQRETAPHWYDDKILELFEILGVPTHSS